MDSSILEKIVGLSNKLADIQKQLADPAVMADMKRYVQLNKEYKELGPVVKAGTKYQKMVEDYNSAKDILQNEKDDVVIAISQSGETADTLAAIQLAKQQGALVFGIVNGVGSSIARESDTGIYIHVGPEIGVASTRTTQPPLTG